MSAENDSLVDWDTERLIIETPEDEREIIHSSPCEGDSVEIDVLRKRRLVRTLCMVIFYIGIGLCTGIIPVSILDLQELQNCNVEQLSKALLARAVGTLAASITGAILSDRLREHTDLSLFFLGLGTGLLNAAIPWAPNIYVLALILFLNGLCMGTTNVVCCAVTLGEWGEKSATAMNLIHTFFNIGTLIAPPTTAPFLSHGSNNYSLTDPYDTSSDRPDTSWGSLLSDNVLPILQYNKQGIINSSVIQNATSGVTRVYIPFAIHGSVPIIAGIIFLGFYISHWEYQSAKEKTLQTPNNPALHSPNASERRFKILISFTLFIIYFSNASRAVCFGSFNVYIAVTSKSIHMPKETAALYSTTYLASATVGRVLGTILAKFITIHWILYGCLLLTLCDSCLLPFFALKNELFYWIFTCFFNFISGPFYASTMVWFNLYVEMSGVLISVIDFAKGSGALTVTYLNGHLLHTVGAWPTFIIMVTFASLIVLVIVPLQVYFSIRGNRFHVSTVAVNDEITCDSTNTTDQQ